jgi:hypothetical protein
MSEEIDPVVVDFVLCDGVARDLLTGRLSLLGLMGTVKVKGFPARVTFGVFVRLRNVRESVPLHFEIVDSDGNVVSGTSEAELPKPADLFQDVVTMVQFRDVEIFGEGVYFVQLWRRERYIMDRRLEIELE